MASNTCPICSKETSPGSLFCYEDWRRLPLNLKLRLGQKPTRIEKKLLIEEATRLLKKTSEPNTIQ